MGDGFVDFLVGGGGVVGEEFGGWGGGKGGGEEEGVVDEVAEFAGEGEEGGHVFGWGVGWAWVRDCVCVWLMGVGGGGCDGLIGDSVGMVM